jgi:DNA invertase Pin-like site-specific DNA recombinase
MPAAKRGLWSDSCAFGVSTKLLKRIFYKSLTDQSSYCKMPLSSRKDFPRGVTMAAIVSYFRVSTKKQGESGLGLEGQQRAVADYARQQGMPIIASYTEVESGKRSDRPELLKALAHARRSKATLVVAKLDRLARNVAFLSALMESKANFVACDNPHANKLTIHILAAVAEDEARRISERTKAALGEYKARGGKLGAQLPQCQNLTDEARQRGAQKAGEVLAKAASEAYRDLADEMASKRELGLSLQAIADYLNDQGHTTRRGRPWNPTQVARVLAREVVKPKG